MLDQLVTFPTQVRGNILDLCLTNITERVLAVSEGGWLGQIDHELVEILINADGGDVTWKEKKNRFPVKSANLFILLKCASSALCVNKNTCALK